MACQSKRSIGSSLVAMATVIPRLAARGLMALHLRQSAVDWGATGAVHRADLKMAGILARVSPRRTRVGVQ